MTHLSSETPSQENNPGLFYAEIWKKAVAQMREFEQLWSNLGDEEYARFGNKNEDPGHDYSLVFRKHASPDWKLKRLAGEIFSKLVFEAEKRYSPEGGAKLTIDAYEFYDLRLESCELNDAESFDPNGVWEALSNRYGGDAGTAIALAQTARVIHEDLNFEGRIFPPAMKAGCVDFTMVLYSQKRSDSDQNELGYSSRERFQNLLSALEVFLCSVGEDQAGWHLKHHYLANLNYGRTAIQSRHKTNYGPLSITTYKDKAVFRFNHSLADQLRIFVAKHTS